MATTIKTLRFPDDKEYQINAVKLDGLTKEELLDAVDGLQFKGAIQQSLTPKADCGHVYVVTSDIVINGKEINIKEIDMDYKKQKEKLIF